MVTKVITLLNYGIKKLGIYISLTDMCNGALIFVDNKNNEILSSLKQADCNHV